MFGIYRFTPFTTDLVTYEGEDTPMASPPDEADEKEYPCIIKVTDGKDLKLSTIVSAQMSVPFSLTHSPLNASIIPR